MNHKQTSFTILLSVVLLSGTITPVIPVTPVYSEPAPTQITTTVLADKDSFLTQGSQSNNEGANQILRIISSDKNRPIISFDQNTINDNLKFGRTLQSATLRLHITENGNNWSDGRTIGAHRILDDWAEGNGWNVNNSISGTGSGTTWGCAIDSDISNNQNNCAAQWNGGMFASIPTGTVFMTNNMVNQWIEFDVTSDVQGFLDESMSNYGWMIKKNNEALNGEVQFSSKEFTNPPELRLVVNLSQQEILANQYSAIIDELGNISQVSDESVVTDYLVDSLQTLKTDTQNIVTDINTKQQLVSILDSAINGASEAGNSVLSLDETSANMKISEAKNFVEDYSSQVLLFRGTSISITDADILISKANQISIDSEKAGSDLVTIIIGTPLVITDQLIDRTKTDVINIRNTVNDLKSLGFTVILDAERHSPTQSIITFLNESTMENFEFIISDPTFSMFTALAFYEETLNSGKLLTNEEFVSMVIAASLISVNMNNIQSDVDSVTFALVIACPAHFAYSECDNTFSNLSEPLASFKIGSAANGILGTITSIGISVTNTCIKYWDECASIIDIFSEIGKQAGENAFDEFSPKVIVVTNVINDNNGNLNPSDFIINVEGLFPHPSQFSGMSDPGVPVIIGIGNYNVTEEPNSEYSVSYSDDCVGTIDIGQVKTCTIINNDIPPPVVFFENFDDGNISDWNPCNNVFCKAGVATSALTHAPPSQPFWGFVNMIRTSPFNVGPSSEAIAKFFILPSSGNYRLSGTLVPSQCVSCIISARVYVDNTLALQKIGQAAGSDPAQAIFTGSTILPLTAGGHHIVLASHSTLAYPGSFISYFDNIKIEPIGVQPSSLLSSTAVEVQPSSLLSSTIGGPYFYVEINPSTINATQSSTISIPLEIEWAEGFSSNDVSITFAGNTTDIGVTPSVVSVSNSTDIKLFDLILEVSDAAIIGNHFIYVDVTEMDSEDTQVGIIFLNIE